MENCIAVEPGIVACIEIAFGNTLLPTSHNVKAHKESLNRLVLRLLFLVVRGVKEAIKLTSVCVG